MAAPTATQARATGPGSPASSPSPAAAGAVTTLRIGSWSRPLVRGGQDDVDACADAVLWAGPEPEQADGRDMSTTVVVGHDYCGFDLFGTLPIGTEATIERPGKATLRYRVYARYTAPGQGGPDNGLYWGDLTLQSCVGPDTGFSYLERI